MFVLPTLTSDFIRIGVFYDVRGSSNDGERERERQEEKYGEGKMF